MSDDLEVETNLRLAVASGESVFVRAHPAWLPRVREACALCGRLDDLLVLHDFDDDGRAAVTPWSRIVVKAELGIPDTEGGGRVPDRGWRPAVNRIPTLTRDDLSRPAPVVFAQGDGKRTVVSVLAHLHMEIRSASRGVFYLRARGSSNGVMNLTVLRPRDRTSRTFAPDLDGAGDAWRGFVEAHAARAPARIANDVAVLDRFGCTVVVGDAARRDVSRWMSKGTRHEIHEIDPDGWPVSSLLVNYPPEVGYAVTVPVMCDVVARGGTELLEHLVCGDGGVEDSPASLVSMSEEEAFRRDVPAWGALASRVDVHTVSACKRIPYGHSVFRAVVREPGGGTRRRDFVRTFPVVAHLLLDGSFAALVDQGGRTVPAISSRLRIPRAVARRLSALPSVPDVCVEEGGVGTNTSTLAALMSNFPVDHLPRAVDRREGTAFVHCLDVVSTMARASDCDVSILDPADMAALVSGVPGADWTTRAAALGNLDRARTVADMLSSFGAWLGALGCDHASPDVVFVLMARHRNGEALLRASDAWHRSRLLSGWHGDLPPDTTWPVPFEVVDLAQGWTAVAMASVPQLVDEGADGVDANGLEGLSHCVATYAAACQTGASIIVSLRFEGCRRSTVELAPDPEGDWRLAGRPYVVGQHCGKDNSEPPVAAELAVSRLKFLLRDGGVALDVGALDTRPALSTDEVRSGVRDMLPEWRRLLPKPYRRLDADGLVALADATGARLHPGRSGPNCLGLR